MSQGYTFYDVSLTSITKYEYLMEWPFHNPVNRNGSYHIVINKTIEEPIRIYKDQLKEILNKNISTYEHAKNSQIELAKKHLMSLENYLTNT